MFTKEQLQIHGEVILAYINGAKIECAHPHLPNKWHSVKVPAFGVTMLYRVAKPKRNFVTLYTKVEVPDSQGDWFVSEEYFSTFELIDNVVDDFIRDNTIDEPGYFSTCKVVSNFELEPLE